MIVPAEILDAELVLAVRAALAGAPFRDGRATAGPAARAVKDNEQALGHHPDVAAAARRVRLALEAHALVRGAVRPARWSTLTFARYGPGQRYGAHTDDAVMFDEAGRPVRTDMSFTLFLSDADAYEGGALRVEDPAGDREFRPAAGTAIFYPTGALHGVTPVTRGERLVCVGWVQSLIRQADRRELLFDLERVRGDYAPDERPLLLDKAIGNLVRMWGEE